MIYPVLLFPNPVLRETCRAAHWKSPNTQHFIKHLIATLYAQRGGIGIAAPQVGRSQRIIVVDVSPRDPSKKREIMLNPVILYREGEVLSREGCMSLPDYTANVKRARRVLIEWLDERGHRQRKTAGGIEAICLQHELDHLRGLLFIDRVASLKTDIFVRKGHSS